ncbi:hypothetical protein SEA_PSONYX_119 [Corynebacterium phage PSonyx]|nr:hypothetical protein SEA_PSONYX_119 [Corynebacterium phage PSonyx]
MNTTTFDMFEKLALDQSVLETDSRMVGTDQQRFYLHLINGRTVQFEVDGNDFLTTVWEEWDEEDEGNFTFQEVTPLNEAEKWIKELAQGEFTVRFTEHAETTPNGQTRQYAEVTNNTGDEIGWIVWLTDNAEEFEPELYAEAAREYGWELSNITPQGATAHLAK